MKLTDSFDGSDNPFEGDLTFNWHSLPANARVTKAGVTLTPAQGTAGKLFEETLVLTNGRGDWGATQITGTDFSEVDFHKRRTFNHVAGTGVVGANLQVDLGGGAYVEINDKGAIRAPDDTLFTVPSDGRLPGFLVTRFKLTTPITSPATLTSPGIARVTLRSVPSNVSVRLGNLPPFWTHLGDLSTADTSPDFAAVLQAFLAEATVENGYYQVPLILHSDTIARLRLTLDIEYRLEASVMPAGLSEVQLPYAYASLPNAQDYVLHVDVPANMRIAGVTARIRGAFEESRIAYGATGSVTPEGVAELSTQAAQAQPLSTPETLEAKAFDLFMSVTQASSLQLDVREDLDGKPGEVSLLPGVVKFELSAPTGNARTGNAAVQSRWVSVALPAELEFQQNRRYWLVLQSLQGRAGWYAVSAEPGRVGLQQTKDGGLSWRDTVIEGISGSAGALFRLRYDPERYITPIELQVGIGDQAVRVSLDRFQPLGRVDFALDFDEVGQAFNQYLQKIAPAVCPETEHLANGDFEQWRRVGETIGTPVTVLRQEVSPTAVAVSPDGRLAYVGADDVMLMVDIACDTFSDKTFDISGVPRAIVFHPGANRAFMIGSDRLQLIDTEAQLTLGGTLSLNEGATAAVLNPDGGLLFVTEYDSATGFQEGFIRVIDTLKLEQAAVEGTPVLEAVTSKAIRIGFQREPTAVAVAPDGSRLYVSVVQHGTTARGEVHIFDTASSRPVSLPIPLSPEPVAIALTPDGKWLLVANAGNANSVSMIDTRTLVVVGTVNLSHTPAAIAIAPDGLKAYVASGNDSIISIIDLGKRSVIGTLDANAPQTAIVLTPQGDRSYVILADGDIRSLASFRIGTPSPMEWNLTSGWVVPYCLPDPFHRLAVLGRPPGTSESKLQIDIPTALSQTVPVTASCPYEFSFWGIADESGALAEVLWIGSDCGLIDTEQVPIQVFESAARIGPRTVSHAVNAVASQPQLLLHRLRMTAPTGAEQAEVRFTVPEGSVAGIDRVSLMATNETLVNADLSLRQAGKLDGWDFRSPQTGGVTLVPVQNGVQLRNFGNESAELTQTVPVQAGQPFSLEFQGRAIVQASATAMPRIELQWLQADESPLGVPTVLTISPAGLDTASASGTAPDGATEAALRLAVAPGTTLEIQHVSLRFSNITRVPVTFVAQAPGELSVSDWRVTFEQIEPASPRRPDQGLCAPTPPGGQPGTAGDDCCFCPCCESEQVLTKMAPVETLNDRLAIKGRCSGCGADLIRFGV